MTACGFTLPCFETVCVRPAGHVSTHRDANGRAIEWCPAVHPRHGVVCVKGFRHSGPHVSGRFAWSNI